MAKDLVADKLDLTAKAFALQLQGKGAHPLPVSSL